MITRRQFLKLSSATVAALMVCRVRAISALAVPKPRMELSADAPQEVCMPPGNQWVFPLAFPAWFPVEPRIPHEPASRIHLPVIHG